MWKNVKLIFLIQIIFLCVSKECCVAAAGAEPLSVERKLMAPGQECIEDIPALLKYAENCGQQRQRLTEDSEFTRESLRFIKSVDELSLGYGVLPAPTAASNIPKLALPKDTYVQLREIGMAVKILLGYLSLDTDAFLTPDATNVLVPHISCIVQTSTQGSPELRPIGFLRQQKDAPIIVLLSANQGTRYKRSITEFFNKIYRRDRLPEIHVIDAEEVSENYISHVIKGWISQSYKIEPFTDKYLAGIIQNIVIARYQNEKDAKTPQYGVSFISSYLKLLLEDNIDQLLAKNVHLDYLMREFWEGQSPEKPSEKDKKSFIQVNKSNLIKAAIKGISEFIQKLEKQEAEELQSLLDYIETCLFPEENLSTLAACKTFWGEIKKLNLTCVNPDSPYGNKISVDARLRKYFSAGYGASHTEQILVKYLRANPHMLTNALEAQVVPDAGATEDFFNPLFLGYVIDSFSWIDVCSSCASFLHSTDVWKDVLRDTVPSLEKKGYRVIINPLDSVFRFVSQHAYDGAPLDLSIAGGGSDYLKRGWDFRFLSKERIALNTRSSREDSIKMRDQTIERLQSRLMSKALSEPFDFWRTNTVVWDLIINQSKTNEFFRNALIALHLKHPDQKSVRLGLAYREESNRLALLQNIVEEETAWSEDEKPLLQSFYQSSREPYPLSKWPQEYSKAYYGGALLKKIDECLEPKDYSQVKSKLRRFARYCLVYFENDTHDKLDFNEAVTKIIQCWKTFWQAGSKHDSWSTPEEVDKPNMEAIINLLWKLAYKKDYADILNSEERENLVEKLKCLTQPKWVKDLLAPKAKETKDADELDEAA